MDKRTFIKSAFLGVTGVIAIGLTSRLKAAKNGKKWDGVFRLPELPFAYGALVPFTDAETLKRHHAVYHASYTDNLNAAVQASGLTGKSAYELLKNSSKYSGTIRQNAGGYLNHKLFWRILAPASGKKPSAELSSALTRDFGSVEEFKSAFRNEAISVFDSGWAWLITDKTGKLKVTSTRNQDNPLMDICDVQGIPILCLDVCDHAGYLKDEDREASYINAFWDVVNWDVVSMRYSRLRTRWQS